MSTTSHLYFGIVISGLEIATDTVANAPTFSPWGLVTTLATRFLYDLDLN